MKVNEIAKLLSADILASGDPGSEVTSGYVCDMLSWVMAKSGKGAAWITVQTHLNVIAVAVLLDIPCVIIPDSIQVEKPTIDKAKEEGVTLLSVSCSAFDACALLSGKGIRSYEKK